MPGRLANPFLPKLPQHGSVPAGISREVREAGLCEPESTLEMVRMTPLAQDTCLAERYIVDAWKSSV